MAANDLLDPIGLPECLGYMTWFHTSESEVIVII